MKLSSLVGLTVISLDSGRAIGEIKKLLLDADPKKVEFIVLDLFDDKREGFAVHLFRYADLQGMGDVAVTIGSLDQVRTISSEALYQQVFADQISIAGSRVISHVGNDLGRVKDFVFDAESAVIQAIVLEEDAQLYYYKAEPYLLISEKCLVLNPDQLINAEEYESYSKEEPDPLASSLNPGDAGADAATEGSGSLLPGFTAGGQEVARSSGAAFRPVETPDNVSGEMPPRRFVQNMPRPNQGPAASVPPSRAIPPFAQAPQPQRSFQQHVPGAINDITQPAPSSAGSPPLKSYDLAEPKVPEMPATQKRAGGLFFRRGEKKPKPAPKEREVRPQVEETMNDQDMLDAMKGFMKS